ncbi:MAG: lytic transglycosylase domain-containing protein [Veillonellales bacterium]
MRRKLFTIWYALLLTLVLEVLAYWLTGFVANSYRKMVWAQFNNGVKEWKEADSHLPYAPLINRFAGCNGLNGEVVAAVIQAESSFQPHAVSRTGAYGLMQVMPATWQQVNRDLKICTGRHKGDCTSECYINPELNIQIGTAYLGQLLRRYNGDMILALAAYNAGPGAVDQYGGIPPYSETIRYVDQIIDYWYKEENRTVPLYRLKAGHWEEVRSGLGRGILLTLLLIAGAAWKLTKRNRSWRWRY